MLRPILSQAIEEIDILYVLLSSNLEPSKSWPSSAGLHIDFSTMMFLLIPHFSLFVDRRHAQTNRNNRTIHLGVSRNWYHIGDEDQIVIHHHQDCGRE